MTSMTHGGHYDLSIAALAIRYAARQRRQLLRPGLGLRQSRECYFFACRPSTDGNAAAAFPIYWSSDHVLQVMAAVLLHDFSKVCGVEVRCCKLTAFYIPLTRHTNSLRSGLERTSQHRSQSARPLALQDARQPACCQSGRGRGFHEGRCNGCGDLEGRDARVLQLDVLQ